MLQYVRNRSLVDVDKAEMDFDFPCLCSSLILGIEIFGSANIIPMAVVVAFCYVFSGYFSLYSAQKFVYSKTKAEFINKDAE